VTEARLYDRIGTGYPATRRTEPRIAARIDAALGTAGTVVNVGAGTGCYEPPGRRVTAVEPSAVMLGQRPSGAAPAVQAVAESLPFANASFDAAMAVWTVHHWADPAAGLAELRRTAGHEPPGDSPLHKSAHPHGAPQAPDVCEGDCPQHCSISSRDGDDGRPSTPPHGGLRALDELDLGYRLVIATPE